MHIRISAGMQSPRSEAMTPQSNTTFKMIAHFQELAEHDKAELAGELHDELGGFLIGAVMDLSMLAPCIATLGKDAQVRMGRIRQALGSAIELTRRISEQLRPTLLDNVGLFTALRWQLKNACARSNVACTDALPAIEPQLTPRASIALFRSIQEALIVGIERPEVTQLELVGSMDDTELSIQMIGNGGSLSDKASEITHLVLESIRHRIRALGGAVVLENPSSGGIVLAMTTPAANVVAR
jgi:signal transduction histidine kinase